MTRRPHRTALPAPYLQRITRRDLPGPDYPFNLPWLQDPEFELTFHSPVTILVGENGTGKSTLADALRASWLPKVTKGWFFRAETFFSVARSLDEAAREVGAPPPDFLSHSHGEGFTRLFAERMTEQGIYFLDEPESALSPRRQIDLLRLLARIAAKASAQVIMATHSPLLMAIPGAALLELTRHGIAPTALHQTRHFKLYSDFASDPQGFIAEAIADPDGRRF